jgi:hypothetical protein
MVEIKKNENQFDRFVKILIGSIILFLTFYYLPGIPSPWNILYLLGLLFVSLWMIITGIIGYCPLYNLLGINTAK